MLQVQLLYEYYIVIHVMVVKLIDFLVHYYYVIEEVDLDELYEH